MTRRGGQHEEERLETEEVGEARSTSMSRTDHLEPGRGLNWTSKRQRTNLPNFESNVHIFSFASFSMKKNVGVPTAFANTRRDLK